MRIEVGAGCYAVPGFLAVDVNPRCAGVVADVRALPFRTGSVTALRATDILEHISYRQTADVLAEWARVCRRGARVYVQCPDAERIMRWFCANDPRLTVPPELPQTPLAAAAWRLLGGHFDGGVVEAGEDWRWNAHYAFFSEESLSAALADAGFRVMKIRSNPFPNLCCQAVRR